MLDTDTPATDHLTPYSAARTVEYVWIVTVQYHVPGHGTGTSSRMGVATVTPGVTTRVEVLNKVIGDVKAELNAPGAIVLFASLEPNQL